MAQVPTYNPQTEVNASSTNVYVPSGASSLWSEIMDIGNRVADKTTKKAAETQGLADQQALGGGKLARQEGAFGDNLYTETYNKAAETQFAVHKRGELEEGMQALKRDYAFDPDKFNEKAEAFKSKFMQSVPLDLQPNYLLRFSQEQIQRHGEIVGAKDKLDHANAGAAVASRLEKLRNELYSITETHGDKAADHPEFQRKMGEFTTLLESARDPNQTGGPLLHPDTAAKIESENHGLIRKAEIVHGYNGAKNKEGYIKAIESGNYAGEKVDPNVQKQITGELWTKWHRDEGERRQALSELKADVANAEARLLMGLPVGDLSSLTARVNASGNADVQTTFRTATNANSQMQAFALKTQEEQARELDRDRQALGASTDKSSGWLYTKKLGLFNAAQQQMNQDPMEYAAQHGVIPMEVATKPLDLSSPASINERRDAMGAINARFGRNDSMLKPAEIRAYAAQWDNWTVIQKTQFIDGTLKLTGAKQEDGSYRPDFNASDATLRAIDKETPSIALFARMMASPTTRTTAIKALDGLEYAKNNKDAVDRNGHAHRVILSEIKEYLPTGPDGRPLDPSGKITRQMTDAVFGLYALKTREDKDLELSESGATNHAKNAVAEIFGYSTKEELPKIGSRRVVPFETGLPASKTKDIWKSITDDDLKGMNGGELPTDHYGSYSTALTAKQITERGFPVYEGRSGKYRIGMEDNDGGYFFITGKDGKPFIWDYANKKDEYKARVK